VCDNALLTGFRLSQKKIDPDTIRGVIKNLEGPRPRKIILSAAAIPSRLRTFPFGLQFLLKRGVLFVALSLLCVGALVFLTYQYLQPKSVEIGQIKSLKPPMGRTESASTSTSPPRRPSSAAVAARGREYSLKKIVAVKRGQTLSQLAQEYYGMVNLTLIDLLLELNPTITNVNLILVDEEIKIPNITEPLLIIPSPDSTYAIHAGTFENSDPAKLYADERGLKGKKVEISLRKVSPGETWHRVTIGKFDNKDEALKMIFLLKEKGLLPAFGGLSRMK